MDQGSSLHHTLLLLSSHYLLTKQEDVVRVTAATY